MLFSTPTFLFLFLPAVLTGYFLFLLPGVRMRNAFLLLASLVFYAWGEGFYLGLLLLSIVVNYGFGLWLGRVARGAWGRPVVLLGVAANLALLSAFKYAAVLTGAANGLLGLVGAAPLAAAPVHLPIGLSFFTFQALSYVIDVYRGRCKVQANPLTLALYIALFPQLILGPIVRYRDIARQLAARTVSTEGFVEGIGRFVVGLGKKVLLADTLATTADRVFALPNAQLGFAVAWLGILAFTLQLYFDFSGYADMAIGLGRMFGFRFRENFNYPYAARSRTEFFQRWHISFFTWLRDYLYRPLTPKHSSALRQNANILLVFLCAGLWHGAGGTYLAWGAFHGTVLVIERVWLGRRIATWWRPFRHGYVFAITFVSNAFFRGESLAQSAAFLTAMAGFGTAAGSPHGLHGLFGTPELLALLVGLPASLPVLPLLKRRWAGLLAGLPEHIAARLEGAAVLLGRAAAAGVLVACVLVVSASTYDPFIYFRF